MVAKAPRQAMILGTGLLVALAAGYLAYQWSSGRQMPLLAREAPNLEYPQERPIPGIGLNRLKRGPAEVKFGRRDPFSFGQARTEETEAVMPPPEPEAFQPRQPLPIPGAGAPSIAPMSLKFIGMVKTAPSGIWVAALQNERQEILTGKEGEVVANRFRIVKIGLESVELQELGTERTHHIRLGGS